LNPRKLRTPHSHHTHMRGPSVYKKKKRLVGSLAFSARESHACVYAKFSENWTAPLLDHGSTAALARKSRRGESKGLEDHPHPRVHGPKWAKGGPYANLNSTDRAHCRRWRRRLRPRPLSDYLSNSIHRLLAISSSSFSSVTASSAMQPQRRRRRRNCYSSCSSPRLSGRPRRILVHGVDRVGRRLVGMVFFIG
jgi:hypothetical protein